MRKCSRKTRMGIPFPSHVSPTASSAATFFGFRPSGWMISTPLPPRSSAARRKCRDRLDARTATATTEDQLRWPGLAEISMLPYAAMSESVLVTGIAGFIGSHVAEHCLRAGMSVIGVDDLSGGFLENVPKG